MTSRSVSTHRRVLTVDLEGLTRGDQGKRVILKESVVTLCLKSKRERSRNPTNWGRRRHRKTLRRFHRECVEPRPQLWTRTLSRDFSSRTELTHLYYTRVRITRTFTRVQTPLLPQDRTLPFLLRTGHTKRPTQTRKGTGTLGLTPPRPSSRKDKGSES